MATSPPAVPNISSKTTTISTSDPPAGISLSITDNVSFVPSVILEPIDRETVMSGKE